MTDLPQAAVEAAQKSVRAGYGVMAEAMAGQIRYALAAAAPIIAAAERERLAAVLDAAAAANAPRGPGSGPIPCGPQAFLEAANVIRTTPGYTPGGDAASPAE